MAKVKKLKPKKNKKMELLNGEIFAAVPALQELSQTDLPVKTSFGVAKLIVAFNPIYEAIEKTRSGIVTKYGKPDENNRGQISIQRDTDEFQKYLEDFAKIAIENVEVDLSSVNLPLLIPEEVDGNPVNLPARILTPLDRFIKLE